MPVFSPHSLITQVATERFLIYQCLLRRGVLVDSKTLGQLITYSIEDHSERAHCLDVSCFSLSVCLLDNPSGVRPDISRELEEIDFGVFLELLCGYAILTDTTDYMDRLGKKLSLFDQDHLGNFHQQLGDAVFKDMRLDPEEWWLNQKFGEGHQSIRRSPYLWCQEAFVQKLFGDELAGKELLDYGCGIGYYSRLLAKKGANVTGVDPCEHYLDIARQEFSLDGRTRYLHSNLQSPDDLSVLDGKGFDVIFMCDVFLYYFEPYQRLELSAPQLLSELVKRLKPGGRILIIDPHGCFHLQAWMGSVKPYLLSTEYRHRSYRATPTLEEVSLACEEAGLTICRVRELYNTLDGNQESAAEQLTSEFPLWWFFELRKA